MLVLVDVIRVAFWIRALMNLSMVRITVARGYRKLKIMMTSIEISAGTL